MSDQGLHWTSLGLVTVGVLAMLAAAAARIAPAPDYSLPHFETSRPALPDWPRHSMVPRV